MTNEIALSLIILLASILLFLSEKLRFDLIALLVLLSLSITGIITPEDAFSGFSNPAVITVWAVFILSGAITHTGLASMLGRQVLRVAGRGELRLIITIMLAAAFMSTFMNNVGVVAMLLPIVVDIARRTRQPASKLLIPLTFGSLLGGSITLIGTPANILASAALVSNGLSSFQFFDFAPIGLVITLLGIAYMALIGRHLLPSHESTASSYDPAEIFRLKDYLFSLILPPDSTLAGKTLADSRLGSALGLTVIAVVRQKQTHLAPNPEMMLLPEDRLVVSGRADRLRQLADQPHLEILPDEHLSAQFPVDQLTSPKVRLFEALIPSDSSFCGSTLAGLDFRPRFGAIVLAMLRSGKPISTDLQDIPLQADDRLLLQTTSEQLEQLRDSGVVKVLSECHAEAYHLEETLHRASIPPGSSLHGLSLTDARFGTGFGLGVMAIIRAGRIQLMPDPEARLESGDVLLLKGARGDLEILQGLQSLEYDRDPPAVPLDSEQVGLVDVVLSPHSSMAGKSLRQIHFREKYGLSVLAIWRRGRDQHQRLRSIPLQFGDALLLYGPRAKMRLLAAEPDFLVLAEELQAPVRTNKAPVAAFIMAATVLSIGIGWLPVAVAAVAGAAMMVLSGSVSMEEAYRSIEWQVVFLIAGMLPLGIALEQNGAAAMLADSVVAFTAPYGPAALLAGIFLLTMLAAQILPNPVVVVVISPIIIGAAASQGLSPYSLMMTAVLGATSTYLTPIGHPANILVLNPGNYRIKDFIKTGLPLVLLVLIVVLTILPLVWPLSR